MRARNEAAAEDVDERGEDGRQCDDDVVCPDGDSDGDVVRSIEMMPSSPTPNPARPWNRPPML